MELADKKRAIRKLVVRSKSEIVQSKRRDDALTELELLYENLKLDGDDELLDRAERRDLPAKFQKSWRRGETVSGELSGRGQDVVDGDGDSDRYEFFNKRRSVGTMEALMTSRSHSTSPSLRTPPYRRSAIPDLVNDDVAVRKAQHYNKWLKSCRSDSQVNCSYLLLSSAYTPTLHVEEVFSTHQPEPNIEFDDLSYRKLKQADAANVLPPPPPFGIPNYIVGHSSTSDYLHSDPMPKKSIKLGFRFKHTDPHPIHDDLAFRSLRKDLVNSRLKRPVKVSSR